MARAKFDEEENIAEAKSKVHKSDSDSDSDIDKNKKTLAQWLPVKD